MKIGNIDITNPMLGDTPINVVRRGDVLIWQRLSIPLAPENLRLNPQAYIDNVPLEWNVSNGAVSYNIYRDGFLIQSGISTTTFVDSTVSRNTNYEYTVTAVNEAGESDHSDLLSVITDTWKYVGGTVSNDSAWAFDRLRLFTGTNQTKVALFSQAEVDGNDGYLPNGQGMINADPLTYGAQIFSSAGSFEHDFTFDLSANSGIVYIAITGIPINAEFQQIYADPTGYSATRNKNAKITAWDFSVVNTGLSVGSSPTSIIMRNQPVLLADKIFWFDNTRTPKLYAKTLWFQGSNLTSGDQDNILIWADAGGQINGSMNYSNQTSGEVPTSDSYSAYSNLIAKGWIITGPIPPEPTLLGVNINAPIEGEEVLPEFTALFEINGTVGINIVSPIEGEEVPSETSVNFELQ